MKGIKSIKSIVLKCVSILKLLTASKYFDAECYFPELIDQRKTKTAIFLEQCGNIIKYGSPNDYYFLYGLDIKGFHKKNDYVDYSLFISRRNAMDWSLTWYPPIAVLRDKALFGIVAEAYGIRTPKNYGIIKNEMLYQFGNHQSTPLRVFTSGLPVEEKYNAFIKKIDGECAEGIFHVIIKDGAIYYCGDADKIDSVLEKDKRYLLQSAICNQHPDINAIYPKAVNTLRLVTVHNQKTNEIEVFSCVLRLGKGGSVVDNWAAGGLSVGVDTEKGSLRKYGFYKPGYGTKTVEHPDSHIVFEGYKIPFMNEAIFQAKKFHRHLYGMHSIGWDVAITTDGPCFVEGNDNWEISLMQISNYGLQKEFDNLFY